MREQLIAQVATILEAIGWTVEVGKDQMGIKVDITATDTDGHKVIIDCKSYRQLVGLQTVREFASIVSYLRESDPALKAWLLTTSGFTANSIKALIHFQIDAVTLQDLKQSSGVNLRQFKEKQHSWEKKTTETKGLRKRIFVIMPFSEEMLDVFIFGIRWAANELHVVAERADSLEHNGEIINEIRNAIKEYDVVIADTSGANANVCYEVGYAHALDKPTILICRKGEKLPFDLQGTNHLIYANILSLREPLKDKLQAALLNTSLNACSIDLNNNE